MHIHLFPSDICQTQKIKPKAVFSGFWVEFAESSLDQRTEQSKNSCLRQIYRGNDVF